MATCVNILYDRGISAAQCFQAEVGFGWCLHQANAVPVIRYGQEILTKLEDNLRVIEMFRHIGGKPKPSARESEKPSVKAAQHKSCWICLSTVGKSDPKSVTSHSKSWGLLIF